MKKRSHVPTEFLGAFKRGHRKSVQHYIDEDLSWDLLDKIIKSNWTDSKSIKELAYITKFYNEYYKNVIKKNDPTAIHNTDELRKECYDRQNAMNRDVMNTNLQAEIKPKQQED